MLSLIERYWLHLTIFSITLITVGSLTPLPALPELPGTDKTHHLIAYAALMFPVGLRQPRGWIWLACLFAAWSGVIELIQPWVNRYGEWLDLVANCLGLLIGAMLAMLVRAVYAGKNTDL